MATSLVWSHATFSRQDLRSTHSSYGSPGLRRTRSRHSSMLAPTFAPQAGQPVSRAGQSLPYVPHSPAPHGQRPSVTASHATHSIGRRPDR